MAPRDGACVRVVSPRSGSVTVLSRSVSVTSTSGEGRGVLSALDANATRAAPAKSRRHVVPEDLFRTRCAPRATPRTPSLTSQRASEQTCDADAVTRAMAVLQRAGTHVLRGTARRMESVSLVNTTALQLPPTLVPQPSSDTDRSHSASSHRAASRKRSHSVRQDTSGVTGSCLPRSTRPRTMVKLDDPADPPTATLAPLCPGMFCGLSAIDLDEHLFDGVPAASGATRGRECHATENAAASKPRGACATPQLRLCAHPMWSLIGTFRAALSSVVDADVRHDTLRWTQRNPRGGYQLMRLPLHALTSVTLVRLVQEDASTREAQYTLRVCSSARPSQVVFGFRTQNEAVQLRSFLQAHLTSV